MSIIAAAFCPHPPLLVPAVGAGEPVAVRGPAVAAVKWLAGQPVERIVVLGSGDVSELFPEGAAGNFAGFGVDFSISLPGTPSSAELPLPLAVGAWLLAEAGWGGPAIALICDASGGLPEFPAGPRDGLLVMGDGSARRTEKAPGWLDERAAGFDAGVGDALAAGDPAQLARDLTLGAELLAAGAPAWGAASRLLAGRKWSAGVSYDDAPYGVGYFVATWASAPSNA
jgi:hypothetical protein